MDVKTAIASIDDVLSADVHYDESIEYQLTTDDCDWLEAAKAALQKQQPMERHHTRVIHIDGEVRESVCPSCLGVVATNSKEYPRYCTWCGQAIECKEG